MLHASRKWIAPFLASLAVAAIQAPSAQAAFMLTIQEDALPPIIIVSGDPLFDSSPDPSAIQAVVNAVNTGLQYFSFTSLSATSNSSLGGPADAASLTQGGEVGRKLLTTGTHTLTITASDQFSFPGGDPKTMQSTASDSYNKFIVAGGLRTFQSIFDATGAGGSLISSPVPPFQLVPTLGAPGSDAVSASAALGSQPIPFTLTNVTTITLGPDGSASTKQDYTFGGITNVTAVVPEPSSLGLGLISLPALLALGRRMRRRNDA